MFREKIKKLVPTLEYYSSLGRTAVKKYAYLSNIGNNATDKIEVPYINEVKAFLNATNGCIGKRLLISTENVNVAIKALAYIMVHRDEYYEEDDCLYGYDYDFDEEDEDISEMVRIIDLSGNGNDEKMAINKYLHLISDVKADDLVVFTGITNEVDIREKLDVIGACPAGNVCLYINPKLSKEWWVQQLQIDYGFKNLELTSPDKEYYEKCVKCLVDEEGVKLPKGLSEKRLVQYAYKNKGNELKEEDVAWYMDLFFNNSVLVNNIKNPLTELDNMIGLDNLKQIARELSSIAKEELRNEKLGVLHKNMIFVGNPGTGKTTGAKMLADILAWDGNANSKLIVADRRKIIGKYVGHTAPKVSGLFEEADGGVLFVDEAGFFLNRDSGGYVDEAIKEFVRYMELYPQVTVIFALYSNEIKDFLELDSGLTSRISRFVKFEDYSNEQLTAITVDFLKKKGYEADEAVANLIGQSIIELKSERKKSFGNARGARSLAETIIISSSMRRYDSKKNKSDIQLEDVKAATDRLKNEQAKKKQAFGFVNENARTNSYSQKNFEYAF